MRPARRRYHRSFLLAVAVSAIASGSASGDPVSAISASASPGEIPIGAQVTVSGSAGTNAGTALSLEAATLPFKRFLVVGSAETGAGGSYTFAPLTLDENTRLRVSSSALATSPPVAVTVDPRIAIHAASLGPGRERLSTRIIHAGRSGPVTVSWYLAGPSHRFAAPVSSQTRELSPGVSYASVIVNPPARRFTYRICLNPPWENRMGEASGRGRCPAHGIGATGKGRGIPQPPFPSPAAIAAAGRWLRGRAGATSMAVVDSSGRLSGVNLREHFETASVIKVMFLTAYLQRLERAHRALDAHDNALLYPMIHESNNEDASAVLGAVGEPAVQRVAREAGMQDYAPGVGWWAYSQTSAADQARFFARLAKLVPRRFWPYARGLMAGIEPEQSWGIPPVARPAWQVFFKTGALPEEGLFNEVALLERGHVSFTVAVLTTGDPSKAYGEETIAGVASRLLAGAP